MDVTWLFDSYIFDGVGICQEEESYLHDVSSGTVADKREKSLLEDWKAIDAAEGQRVGPSHFPLSRLLQMKIPSVRRSKVEGLTGLKDDVGEPVG